MVSLRRSSLSGQLLKSAIEGRIKEANQRRIDRALDALKHAVRRSRTEDFRDSVAVSAELDFLDLRATETWPFEQFRKAIEDFSPDGFKAEAGWQVLNASLNGIKRAIVR